nr:hypothetical protein BaRGS_011625 [Batillaria attramentaria]
MQQKTQTFFHTCLRLIFNIRWPEKIQNEELWERAGQEPVAKQILRRKWGWIGHNLRKPASSTTHQALTWNPQGKRCGYILHNGNCIKLYTSGLNYTAAGDRCALDGGHLYHYKSVDLSPEYNITDDDDYDDDDDDNDDDDDGGGGGGGGDDADDDAATAADDDDDDDDNDDSDPDAGY